MYHLATFSLFVFRLILTSAVALAFQIFLIVKRPDWLLSVQETVKGLSVDLFRLINTDSSYRVAYNLINGDGLVVHTFFVFIAFVVLFALFLPAKLFRSVDQDR